MAEIEKIRGQALLQMFTDLQAEKIPLEVQLIDGRKIHLPFIRDIRKRKKLLHFLVNQTEESRQLSGQMDPSNLRFEFTDKEHIKYVFETDTWEFSRDLIWFRFPKFVQRFQRRRLFRLEAPPGTRLFFKFDGARYKLLVINISLGGTLGVLVNLTQQMENDLKRLPSKILTDVELVIPGKDRKKAGSIVKIDRCQIKRQPQNPLTGKFECAIEFVEISDMQHKHLTALFYKWQREYLRKRRFLEA